jgi:nitrogenase iron protein NifH
MRQIALYRKGKIGRSPHTQNLTAVLATIGNKILLVGFDSKADSIRLLPGDLNQKTALDTLKNEGNEGVDLDTVLQPGFGNTKCVESGGSEPGVRCAGREIITSIGLLENNQSNNLVKNFVFTVLYRNPETYYLVD